MKQLFGSAAFVLTLLISMPQAIKVMRTKHTKDLSLTSYLLLVGATASWVGYGLLSGDLAVWGANAIGLAVAGIIVGYKLRYG